MTAVAADNQTGRLGAALLSSATTGATINLGQPWTGPTVASPNFVKIIYEPPFAGIQSARYEVVTCTAVEGSALATIVARAQDGSGGPYTHGLGSIWSHGPDAADWAALASLGQANIFTEPQTLPLIDHGGESFNVRGYGVKADGQMVNDGAMNGTTGVLTSASEKFVAGDVGKLVLVTGAGVAGALLTSTIASYQSATQVTLTAVSHTAASSAYVTWGTDDTTATQALLNAVPAGSTVKNPGVLLTTAELVVPNGVHLKGTGFVALYGGAVGSGDTQFPGIWPFFLGAQIVPCTAGQNGISITATGARSDQHDVLIRFADGIAFVNTGHGFHAAPSTVRGAGHENGMVDSRWDNLTVFGHDGNHYAFYELNSNYMTGTHLRGYGGGGLFIDTDATDTPYGNAVYINPYFVVFCGGTANGVTISSSGGDGQTNLIDFYRPQVNMIPVPAGPYAGRGIASVTNAQYIWDHAPNLPNQIGMFNPDLETQFANPINNAQKTGSRSALVPTLVVALDSAVQSPSAAKTDIVQGLITLNDGYAGNIEGGGSSGSLFLKAAGSGEIGFMPGGSASVLASINLQGTLFPVQATTAQANGGNPAYVKGGVYFDTTLNKLRIGGASGWETVTSA